MSGFNIELIEELQVLLDKAKLGSDKNDKFRVKSYKDAIEKIKALDFEIKEEDQIPLNKKSKIYAKIKEFISKGEITQTKDYLQNDNGLFLFFKQCEKVAEIGPAKAKELFEKHGIQSMNQLEKNQHLLNDKQKIGLKYWKSDTLRIPRKEILKHQAFYFQTIKHNKYCDGLEITITGSFRRSKKDSGDIDILCTHPDNDKSSFHEFVDSLIAENYIVDQLAYGDKKFMGYGKLFNDLDIPRRIDIIYCDPKEYAFALLYFTGSGPFNVKMREYIHKQGFKLNEKGLIDLETGTKVKQVFKTEKDIFDFFGLEYLEPEDRIDTYKF
jgi:DNA polymerase/3'-5' exonuclease PolX